MVGRPPCHRGEEALTSHDDAPPPDDPPPEDVDEGEADPAAWVCSALDRFEGRLLAYAGRIVGDAHRAQDVVQDVFLALCRQDRASIEGKLAPWLYAATRNRALNERRQDRRQEGREMTAMTESRSSPAHALPGDAVGDRLDARDAAARAYAALDRLPDAQQEALRLKFQHGLRYGDIAEVMRVTPGNVAVLVHRGIAALRAFLEHAAAGPTSASRGAS